MRPMAVEETMTAVPFGPESISTIEVVLDMLLRNSDFTLPRIGDLAYWIRLTSEEKYPHHALIRSFCPPVQFRTMLQHGQVTLESQGIFCIGQFGPSSNDGIFWGVTRDKHVLQGTLTHIALSGPGLGSLMVNVEQTDLHKLSNGEREALFYAAVEESASRLNRAIKLLHVADSANDFIQTQKQGLEAHQSRTTS
jgi:hypothetical protein